MELSEKIFNLLESHIKDCEKTNIFFFSQKGYCPCCDKEVLFFSNNHWLRDSLICTNCYSLPRERALMLTIEKYCPNWKNLYIHESSPIKRGASKKLMDFCKNYIASQYYGNLNNMKVDEYCNINLENQIFSNCQFDLVITQDVFEHLYNPDKAFREIARTLKPGGMCIFTVPIINKHKKTELWATLLPDGTPNFLKTSEYHFNPVSSEGSPVTYHWGFDIIDYIRETSKLNTTIECLYDIHHGIMGEYNEVFISKKE